MNKKLAIAAGAVLALIAGGGGGAAFIFPEVVGLGEDDANANASSMPTPPVFVPLEPMAVPFMVRGSVRHYEYLEVAIEVKDAEAGAKVEFALARLRDLFLRDFNRPGAPYFGADGRLRLNEVKRRLRELSGQVLEAGLVGDVLILQSRKSVR